MLDLSVVGAKQVYDTGLTCNFLFVTPPARDDLKARLLERGGCTDEEIQSRLDAAESEEKVARDAGFFQKYLQNSSKDKFLTEGLEYVEGLYFLKKDAHF